MEEGMLLSGPLEPTNEPYSIGKIAGLKLCQAIHRQYSREFIAAIPTNIYGPQDDFNPENAHVVGALLQRIHEAKTEGLPEVVIWGTGNPRREFIHSDDLAEACLFIMDRYTSHEPVNIGSGTDLSIRELAETIRDVVGYGGKLRFDTTKPDGMPRKSLDCRRLTELGWRAEIPFRDGLRRTYEWYLGTMSSTAPVAASHSLHRPRVGGEDDCKLEAAVS
jgi:GDP-L-fucose synthase